MTPPATPLGLADPAREARLLARIVETISAGLDLEEARAVAELFRHPSSADPPALAFGPVDEVGLHRLLVETHGFSETRVKAAIARARSRPRPASTPAEARGHQTLLETFGGRSE